MTMALHSLSHGELRELVLVQQQDLIVKNESIQHHEARVFDLVFQIRELKRLLFGAGRERFVSEVPASQLMLKFEASAADVAAAVEAELEKITYERQKPQQKKHVGRMELPHAGLSAASAILHAWCQRPVING